jgi:hypothetical protein
MDKSKIEIKKATEKQLLGLKDRGKITIDCVDCGQPLMIFQICKTNADLTKEGLSPVECKVLVDCGLCGGQSYISKIEGQFYPGSPSDQMCFENIENNDKCDFAFRAWRKK